METSCSRRAALEAARLRADSADARNTAHRNFKVVAWAQKEREVTVHGDWAFERWDFLVTIIPVEGGNVIQSDGRFLRVWQCQADGEWKILQGMWFRNPPHGTGPSSYRTNFRDRFFLERELALAEETQRSLLPQSLPEFQNFRIRAFSKPTGYVGGDMYDFIERDDELITVLADVSGKGVPAALLSSLVQGALQMEFRSGTNPAEVMNRLNKLLCGKTSSSRFVTLFLLAIDSQGTGSYVSAGHNPAYLFRSATRQIDELPSNGLILGSFGFASYEACPLELRSGDVLVVYSDGLTEAENSQGEMLGEERVKEVICRESSAGVECLEKALLKMIQDFTNDRDQTDDITIMAVERMI